MKKLSVILLVALLVSLFSAGTALAATYLGRDPHGGFSTNSNLCADCHTMHGAVGKNLLWANTTYGTCDYCHDGTGSLYNVVDGQVKNTTDATTKVSLAGLFGTFVKTAGSVQSMHPANDQASKAVGTDLGGSASTNNTFTTFSCASCHDPHGKKNVDNARILLLGPNKVPHDAENELAKIVVDTSDASNKMWKLNSANAYLIPWAEGGFYVPKVWKRSGAAAPYTWTDAGVPTIDTAYSVAPFVNGVDYTNGKVYFTAAPTLGVNEYLFLDFYPRATFTATYANSRISTPTSTAQETATYTNTSRFCAGCHLDYVMSTSAGTASGGYTSKYRHAVNVNAVKTGTSDGGTAPDGTWSNIATATDGATAASGALPRGGAGSDKIACLTCHVAHGTLAVRNDGTKSSRLMRQGKLNICEDCHDK